ncbi:hypothetical protein BN190_4700001 [Clostridioides difficile T14]|nr:hypothetical protein BN187_1020001 [Clostridioides difficile E12]CCL93412.1 hypothetical protein BN190_4700001 [Clostridioides difficile T14]
MIKVKICVSYVCYLKINIKTLRILVLSNYYVNIMLGDEKWK